MLQFNKNGKFTVLCFGDLHENIDFDGDGAVRFGDMHALMEAALDECKPDLCVFMGDDCSSRELGTEEGTVKFKKALEAITEPMSRRNIPFASVIGNHGHDHGNEDKMVEIYSGLPCCIMRNDAPEISGNATYNEEVLSSDGTKTAMNIWFMDSNNLYFNHTVSKYDWVHADQIAWYEKKAAELKEKNGGKPVPAILFQHIPVPEEYELLREAKFYELPRSVTGCNTKSNKHYVLKKGIKGYLGEGPCSPDINSGQFASWKKTGDIFAAVFGHDHMNDFEGEVDGITLMQCKLAGFGAYTDGCNGGVRLITFVENNPAAFKTEMKRFKQFGLKAKSLGPIESRITDRQSITLHALWKIGAGAAGAVGAAVGIKKLTDWRKANAEK